MRPLSRRRLLQATSLAAVSGLAGCSDIAETEGEPKVRVVARDPAELTDPGTEPIEVTVLVHNIGIATDVEVTVEAVDYQEEENEEGVIASNSKTEFFEADEQRSVSVELTPGPTANIVFAEAKPA